MGAVYNTIQVNATLQCDVGVLSLESQRVHLIVKFDHEAFKKQFPCGYHFIAKRSRMAKVINNSMLPDNLKQQVINSLKP